ncbi:MAG: hypothetical protein GX815_06115 [Clostridiales bacterium]|nr:hypothetical protein [Clostridiales bacterium]
MKFNSFFTYDELTSFLKDITEQHSQLFSLSSLAETEEGHQLWCLEVTDNETDKPKEYKAGFYIQGNMHAMEFAGSMECVYFLNYIMENHESDSKLRALLKDRVFYIVPRVAIDGTEYVLNTNSALRSKYKGFEHKTMIKKDLNGDGKVLTMRWKSPYGSFKVSDSDDRLMIPLEQAKDAGKEVETRYMMAVEGILNTGKKETDINVHAYKYGEDNIDYNRNFPTSWKKILNTDTGKYPLSEIETRAIADFIIEHPNIIQLVDFHTGNPAIFYPNKLGKHNEAYKNDWTLVETIGKKGEEITDFPFSSGYDNQLTGNRGASLPGSLKDWLYEDRGIIPYILELGLFYNYFDAPRFSNYKATAYAEEEISIELLKWHDAHPDSNLFFEWQPYNHPQLGEVEIGGWNWIEYSNPPLADMNGVCKKSTEFIIHMAEWMPKVEIHKVKTEN